MANHLQDGNDLSVLRDSIREESADLIRLDPPFLSNARKLCRSGPRAPSTTIA